uniref:Uncharacterized protein n=1 Tax=Rhizophora mucronata TaxID=61149 RepID=A0A2P2QD37_RHIMU
MWGLYGVSQVMVTAGNSETLFGVGGGVRN